MKLLKVQNVHEVSDVLSKKFNGILRKEKINVIDAKGYYLSCDIHSKINVPEYRKSRVDGYAVLTEDCKIASESSPCVLDLVGCLNIGEENKVVLQKNQCMYIPTGGMLPENADSMVMIEHTDMLFEKLIAINKSVKINENLTGVGDDIKIGSVIAKKGRKVDERLIGVLVSLGMFDIEVFSKPKVYLLSSGDELVGVKENIKLGQTREINSIFIKNALESSNFEVIKYDLIQDDKVLYKTTIENAIKEYNPDIIITSGGSSKGDKDYTSDIFDDLTSNVFCEGISLKPGKPTILAEKDNRLYIGLPGHPVSSYMVLLHVVLNSFYIGINNKGFRKVYARLSHNVANNQGRESLVLTELVEDDGMYIAKPLYYNSTNIGMLSMADGYFSIGENLEGYKENEIVEVCLFNEK